MGAILFSEQQSGAPITKVAKKRHIPIDVAPRVKGFVTDSQRTRSTFIDVQHPIYWHQATNVGELIEGRPIIGGLDYGKKNKLLSLPRSVRIVTAIDPNFWAAGSPATVAYDHFVIDNTPFRLALAAGLPADINIHSVLHVDAQAFWLFDCQPLNFGGPFAQATEADKQAANDFRGGDVLIFVLLNRGIYQQKFNYKKLSASLSLTCTGTVLFEGYAGDAILGTVGMDRDPHPIVPYQKARTLLNIEVPRFRNHHVIICRIPLEGSRACGNHPDWINPNPPPATVPAEFLKDPLKEDEQLILDLTQMLGGSGRYAGQGLDHLGWELRTISKDEPYSTFTNLAQQYFGVPMTA